MSLLKPRRNAPIGSADHPPAAIERRVILGDLSGSVDAILTWSGDAEAERERSFRRLLGVCLAAETYSGRDPSKALLTLASPERLLLVAPFLNALDKAAAVADDAGLRRFVETVRIDVATDFAAQTLADAVASRIALRMKGLETSGLLAWHGARSASHPDLHHNAAPNARALTWCAFGFVVGGACMAVAMRPDLPLTFVQTLRQAAMANGLMTL